jgi:hypothetical protein
MSDDIISYIEVCQRERTSLQAGMNFGLGGNRSAILMSVRPGAPYRDHLEDGGSTLVYEGHDHLGDLGGARPARSRSSAGSVLPQFSTIVCDTAAP